MYAEVIPTCDICGEPEDQDPYNGREYDWNGETGCHQSCEDESQIDADGNNRCGSWVEM